MKMEVFLYRFGTDIGFANRALGTAQGQHRTIFNDLVFLSAVNQFKKADGGKKKAMQIQILFCIPKRGAGAENPYAISPALADPLPKALETLNRETIIPIKQSLVDLKAQRREIDRLNEGGGLSKIKGGFKKLALKAGTKGREIDSDLFDDVVREVVAAHSRLDFFVQGYDGEAAFLNMQDPHVRGLKVLEEGKMGANFDLVQMGIY